MRLILIILLLIVVYLAVCQKVSINSSVEKYEDVFENSYYPIWTGDITYYLNYSDTSKYIQISGWGDAEDRSFIYINITLVTRNFWLSINPFIADLYNPKIQLGYYFQIFHPPRK